LIQWSVILLADKKWQIRSLISGDFADIEPHPGDGDEIPLRPAQHKPHAWIIKRCATSQDTYLLARIDLLSIVLTCSPAEFIRPLNPDYSGAFPM
jgi:hypothetical protein